MDELVDDVAYVVRMRAAPGRRHELLAVLAELVEAARGEEGTLAYTFHTTADDPDVVVSYERFRDEDALARHRDSPAVEAALPRIGGLVAGAPDTMRLTPAVELDPRR